VQAIHKASPPVGILIDGHGVREPPGPKGLPIVGSYYEVYPDHLGNHQRLFEQFGPVVKTTDYGRTVYYTNDPAVAAVCFAEGGYWAKIINSDHPLFGVRDELAGVFLSNSNTEAWHQVHKYLAPALSPKAVRHYTPQMQDTAEKAFVIFDELDQRGEAWNVYQYMFKIGSTAIGKLALDMDLHHFDSVDAPLHRLVMLISESLELNKKISTYGDWYAHLPFGDAANLRKNMAEVDGVIQETVNNIRAKGSLEHLSIADSAIQASCIVDHLSRAVDQKGDTLPKKYLSHATTVAVGAGFVTTASLLSWCIFCFVTYEDNQERFLQELVDYGVTDRTVWTPDLANSLPFLDKFIKETQRLHNPSYQPGRTALADNILPGGYRIPAESVIIIALHHLHNNPAIWDNPHEFNPDRWDTEKVQKRHKNAYTPFAAGPRMCIGFNFALQEVRVILSELIHRYRFSRVDDAPVQYDPSFQLIRPVNLFVRAQKRTDWPQKSKN
jgi:cytochrome P450